MRFRTSSVRLDGIGALYRSSVLQQRPPVAFLTRMAGRGYESKEMRALAFAVVAAVARFAGQAGAGPSITLNGANIDGVTSQKFDNCTVIIDAQGNVHIEAKGYVVKSAEAPASRVQPAPPQYAPEPRAQPQSYLGPAGGAAAGGSGSGAAPPRAANAYDPRAAPRVTKRYFLASEQSVPDGTQYDLAIFINAQWIREVKSTEQQAVMEITKYLKPGQNKIVLAATKRLTGGGDRKYYTKDVTLTVVIGEGNVGGDHVMIDNPLLQMTRTAAEIDDRTEEYVLEAR